MSERARGGGSLSNSIIGECLYGENSPTPTEPVEAAAKKAVRKPRDKGSAHPRYPNLTQRPAHPSNRLVAQLNESWRVIDDALQWRLQRKDRSFCRTREGLLRCIWEGCCPPDLGYSPRLRAYRGVDEGALHRVRTLPEWHIDATCFAGDDKQSLAFAADELVR
jgi:hypothetical protein